ncbi:hypothetical protein EDC01DRAFT_634596 [Geopyxis carbonaria]|nr:hypothetical protein EDC01DRAFT_634596 [Geopyxis carbonaria]
MVWNTLQQYLVPTLLLLLLLLPPDQVLLNLLMPVLLDLAMLDRSSATAASALRPGAASYLLLLPVLSDLEFQDRSGAAASAFRPGAVVDLPLLYHSCAAGASLSAAAGPFKPELQYQLRRYKPLSFSTHTTII